MQHDDDPARALKIGIIGVIAMMSWPVWLAIVAGQHTFTWSVAASALVPLLLTAFVPALVFDVPARVAVAVGRLEHALHVDNLLHHGHTHRHA